MLSLRKAMLPLHIFSKILCIGAFSLEKLRPSKLGTITTICQAMVYFVIHVWASRQNMSQTTKNMVHQLIDAYNQYSGLCAFYILVIISLCKQSKIVQTIRNIEDVDGIFQQKFCHCVENRKFRRYCYNFIFAFFPHQFYSQNFFGFFCFPQNCIATNFLIHDCDYIARVA